MSQITDKSMNALSASMNLRKLRHTILSSNVANAETPNYHAKKMDFEESLARALDLEGLGQMHVSHKDHFPMGQGAISRVRGDIYENPDVNMSNDGNTVDLEREMAEMSENQLMYEAARRLINKKLGALKYAISEGR